MPDRSRLAHPGVRFPPPLLFAAGFLLAWLVDARVERLRIVGGTASPVLVQGAGGTLVVAGLALVCWGMLTFARAHTAILPNQPAAQLVVSGPYRFTRNPMYTGLTTAYMGLALLANTAWPVLLLPAVLLLLYRLVIRREEAYLAGAFGAEYEAYRRRVGRWL